MKQLLLVRHGRTDWNTTARLNSHTEVALDVVGEGQAARLAQHLHTSLPVFSLWASPALRAQQTAWALAEPRAMAIHTIPEAFEVHFGTFEGRSVADIRSGPDGARFEAWENGDQVDGIESLDDASRRARQVYQRAIEADTPGPIVLVTHGLLIRLIVCAVVLGIAPRAYRHLTIDNASITTIAITDRDIKLTGLNDTHFLQDPGTVWRGL